jgi:hypothetical protein
MTLGTKVRVFCQLVMAMPFIALMLAGLFLGGANLAVYFASN